MSCARLALILAACLVWPVHAAEQVLVVRRGWHIDVGFAAADLEAPLRSIASDLPAARFIFFGFGDMHYLMSKTHTPATMSGALGAGPGILLVTGLQGTPQQGFGAEHVIELELADEDARAVQESIWNSFVSDHGTAQVYRSGPYEGSLYYLAILRYSALHTCNTWAAEILKAGRLHIHSKGTLFAGQLWSQVRRLQRQQAATPSLALQPHIAKDYQPQR